VDRAEIASGYSHGIHGRARKRDGVERGARGGWFASRRGAEAQRGRSPVATAARIARGCGGAPQPLVHHEDHEGHEGGGVAGGSVSSVVSRATTGALKAGCPRRDTKAHEERLSPPPGRPPGHSPMALPRVRAGRPFVWARSALRVSSWTDTPAGAATGPGRPPAPPECGATLCVLASLREPCLQGALHAYRPPPTTPIPVSPPSALGRCLPGQTGSRVEPPSTRLSRLSDSRPSASIRGSPFRCRPRPRPSVSSHAADTPPCAPCAFASLRLCVEVPTPSHSRCALPGNP